MDMWDWLLGTTVVGFILFFVIFVLAYRAFGSISMQSPFVGYFLFALWGMVSAYLEVHQPDNEAAQAAAIIILVVGVSRVYSRLLSIIHGNVTVQIHNLNNLLGNVFLGMMVTQMIFPQLNVVSQLDGTVTANPVLYALLLAYLGTALYLYIKIYRVSFRIRFARNMFLNDLAKFLVLTAVVLILVQLILMDEPEGWRLALYIISRTVFILGLTAYFIQLLLIRSTDFLGMGLTQYVLAKAHISYALFSFDLVGPRIVVAKGFDFIGEQDRQAHLMKLGSAGMVLMGREDGYFEGAVNLPVTMDGSHVGLLVTFWATDPSQEDKRLEGRTFFAWLVALSRQHEWVLASKQAWERAIGIHFKSHHNLKAIVHEKLADAMIEHTVLSIILEKYGIFDHDVADDIMRARGQQ